MLCCDIMKDMIKNIFWSVFAAVLLAPFAVAASQHISGPAGKLQVSLDSPLKITGGLIGLIEALLKLMIQIGTPIAALAIIYSGFLFVAARGNETKITDAKRALTYSIIGTAILIGALVIQQVIANTIGQLIT